jgi:flagellar hook-associated protein 2
VPGLTITLKGETTSDVTAGVSVDTAGAIDKLKTFVENFNMALGQLTVATRTTESERGLLAGDGTIRSMRDSLRRFITSPAEGLNGSLSTFASIGLTFGNIGSAVGTTTDLKLDEAKFREALEANPTAVHDLFAAKPRGVLSSVGDVTAASGTPNEYAVSGTYQIDSDVAGNFTVTFTDVNSVVYPPRQVTVTPGTSSSELVPGMTIETSAAPTGTSSTVTVTHREGIVERVDSYLKGLLGSNGVFASRQSQVDGQIKAIDDQILRQEERIASREEALQRQFSALEVTLSRLQSQSSALSSTLLSLQNSANSNN